MILLMATRNPEFTNWYGIYMVYISPFFTGFYKSIHQHSGNRYLWNFCLPSTLIKPHQPGKPTAFRNGFLKSILFDKLATMPGPQDRPVTMDDLSPQRWKEVTETKTPLERGSIRKFTSTHSPIPNKKVKNHRRIASFQPVFGKGVKHRDKATQPTNQPTDNFPGVGVLAAWATLTLKPLLATCFSPTRTGELGGSSHLVSG